MSSFLFHNTIIPIQATLLGVHHRPHDLQQTIIPIQLLTFLAVKVLGMLQHTNPLSLNWSWLLFSLAVKMPHFWSSKIDKKVINSSTKCLISVKIAILTPHILTPPLVNVWLIFDLQKYVNWLCVFLEVNSCFQRAHVFCMDLQPAADLYNVVCKLARCTSNAVSVIPSTGSIAQPSGVLSLCTSD